MRRLGFSRDLNLALDVYLMSVCFPPPDDIHSIFFFFTDITFAAVHYYNKALNMPPSVGDKDVSIVYSAPDKKG